MPKKPKWNELPCPECREPVAAEATRCPHCQTVYSDSTIEGRKTQQRTNQKVSCGCVGLLGVLLLGFCSVVATNPPEKKDGTEVATSEEVPKPGSASPEITAAMVGFQGEIMTGMKRCDVAGKALAEVAGRLGKGSASIYDAYNAAVRVETGCRDSWRAISDIKVPPEFEGTTKKKAEETLETCQNAAILKQMSGKAMAEVFDGNMKPSKMAEVQEQASAAQAGVLACVAAIFTTAGQAGVELEKLNLE